MRIRELTISNYRAFREEKVFSFGSQFTAIVGINGRGKTAILDGLAILLSWFLHSLKLSSDRPRRFRRSDIHEIDTLTALFLKLTCVKIPVEFELKYSFETGRVKSSKLSEPLIDALISIYGDPNRAGDESPMAIYYTTDRAGFRQPRSLPDTLPRGLQRAYAGALRDRLIDYKELIASYAVWQAEDSPRIIEAFNTALSTFLEEFGPIGVIRDSPVLILHKGRYSLEPAQLSDGERSFVAVLGDLVRRLALANPELKNPLLGAGVVLIDELELHLHPQWQREIVEKLRTTFPNIQFIVTTHSPFIVQTLRPDELILLDDTPVGAFSNRGIEEIATKIMGIEDPTVAPRYTEMLDVAKEYFQALEGFDAAELSAQQRGALKRKLKKLTRPYADNPAYQAFLELQRVKKMEE
jgi:predicted ATP-binding protein involved in virulence